MGLRVKLKIVIVTEPSNYPTFLFFSSFRHFGWLGSTSTSFIHTWQVTLWRSVHVDYKFFRFTCSAQLSWKAPSRHSESIRHEPLSAVLVSIEEPILSDYRTSLYSRKWLVPLIPIQACITRSANLPYDRKQSCSPVSSRANYLFLTFPFIFL